MTVDAVETLAAAVLFALAFLFGGKMHRPGSIGRRSLLSFSAGASVAYIFVHLNPELEGARNVFVRETAHLSLPFALFSIPVATMLGFVIFYGLEQFVAGMREGKKEQNAEAGKEGNSSFRVQTGVFCLYAWLVTYLLVNSLEEGTVPIVFYAVAMGLHFLVVSHSLHREHGDLYDRIGARLLAASAIGGWAIGNLIEFSRPIIAVLLGLIAGGVIMNTMIMELPREKEGRFLPFLLGAVCYTVLLLFSV